MKNSDEPMTEPGPPFDYDDPIWDRFYGDTGRMAELESADRALSAYVHTHPDICMELDSAPGCWHCRAWTAEEFDGEPMILVSYSETQSPTPMEAVKKAIALLDAPIPDYPDMKNSDEPLDEPGFPYMGFCPIAVYSPDKHDPETCPYCKDVSHFCFQCGKPCDGSITNEYGDAFCSQACLRWPIIDDIPPEE